MLNSMTKGNRKGNNMKRKWLLLFASLFLSITMVVGCNNDDQTPPPPDVHNQEDTIQEEPAVKEPQEKAEDLSEDANEVTESEKRRDKEMEENFEESVENLE